jgi:hypothetical protein
LLNAGCPKFSPKGIDAQEGYLVQDRDALSQVMEQASSRNCKTVCRFGNHPLRIPDPATIKNTPGHQQIERQPKE